MQRRAHAHRRQVGRAVKAGADLAVREVRDPAHVRDAAGMHDGRAMKSISWRSMSCLQSQIELKTSPTASGVTECCRINSNAC